MPLSDEFLQVDLRFECPNCSSPIVRKGSWLRVASTVKCEECQAKLRLGYPEKLAIFEKHRHLRQPQARNFQGQGSS
jgi:hypothetical protein